MKEGESNDDRRREREDGKGIQYAERKRIKAQNL
jgi:hypothetical protein